MTQLRNATVARLTLMLVLFISTGAAIAAPVQARLYHNPGCMCCEQYADYLNAKGYDVDVLDTDDMAALNEKKRRQTGVVVLSYHPHRRLRRRWSRA